MAKAPKLIVVTDWSLPELGAKLERLRPLGSRVAIQHRAPTMPTREFVARARELAALRLPLFINGRMDVALLLGAHLHLPEDGPTASECRPHLPPGALISVALHAGPTPAGFDFAQPASLAGACPERSRRDFAQAERIRSADLALVSPVFAPGSKPDDSRPRLGPEGFARIASALPCPSYALGGVGPDNIGQIKGAAGAAVISSVLKAADPLEAARRLLVALGEAP